MFLQLTQDLQRTRAEEKLADSVLFELQFSSQALQNVTVKFAKILRMNLISMLKYFKIQLPNKSNKNIPCKLICGLKTFID